MVNIFQAIYFKIKRNLSYKLSLKFLIIKTYAFLYFLINILIQKFHKYCQIRKIINEPKENFKVNLSKK